VLQAPKLSLQVLLPEPPPVLQASELSLRVLLAG
jgi:hypothetical protein